MNVKSKSLRISEIEHAKSEDQFQKAYDPYFSRKSLEEREEAQMAYNKIYMQKDFFHPWNCISLHLKNATIDFTVKEKNEMFALIHVLNHLVNLVPSAAKCSGSCLRPFNWLNFKMKVSYEAWRQRLSIEKLFK
jgi:hypothetical protein